ncbi:MAG: ribonuclease HII [Buchananella hordeovulneris]|nr:ribonuclease HII [Buchananella hordeovulneris]
MTKAAAQRAVCSREIELPLIERYGLVAGMDEVGRGAIAGPVCVGVSVVGPFTSDAPAGLTDSKLLSPKRRLEMIAPVRQWVAASAVAAASAAEIDALGIVAALRLAGLRALAMVAAQGFPPRLVLLDGTHDWLSEPEADLFATLAAPAPLRSGPQPAPFTGAVQTLVKGDARASVIAAASVLAKVERDQFMAGLPDPGYAWESNKGYGSSAHYAGIAAHGLSDQHRRSWNLRGSD